MKYPYWETGQRIADLRRDYGYSQEKLAEMADISVQFLSEIERGKKNMTVTTLRKMCSALSVTADYIINGESYESEDELIELCKTLSPEKRVYALKILKLFFEATQNN